MGQSTKAKPIQYKSIRWCIMGISPCGSIEEGAGVCVLVDAYSCAFFPPLQWHHWRWCSEHTIIVTPLGLLQRIQRTAILVMFRCLCASCTVQCTSLPFCSRFTLKGDNLPLQCRVGFIIVFKRAFQAEDTRKQTCCSPSTLTSECSQSYNIH